ncbi:hypothetical protein M3Y99_01952200 [Aphelenchoides fujianensis]|nr:hypothetical protein M3Y99_01952200 [Aphelenchoides fujianensis]
MSNGTNVTMVVVDFNTDDIGNTIFMCSLYISLGFVAICANLLNLVTFLTSRDLRKNYQFLIALCSLLWAALSALHFEKLNNDQHCAIISSTSDAFSTFHFLFIVLAYVVSFCSLFVVHQFQMVTTRTGGSFDPKSRAADEAGALVLKIFLLMTSVDICLVSMPAFVMLGAKWQWFHPNDIVVSLSYSTTGFLSIVHVTLNFFFQSEFRRQLNHLWLKLKGRKDERSTAITFVNQSAHSTISKVTMIVHESPGPAHNAAKQRLSVGGQQ